MKRWLVMLAAAKKRWAWWWVGCCMVVSLVQHGGFAVVMLGMLHGGVCMDMVQVLCCIACHKHLVTLCDA